MKQGKLELEKGKSNRLESVDTVAKAEQQQLRDGKEAKKIAEIEKGLPAPS